MPSSETLPLFNTEKKSLPLITPGSNIHVVAEVQFPPYYEDGHGRYYAVKIWEFIAFFASLFLVYHFDKSYCFNGAYLDETILQAILLGIITGLKTYFVDFSLTVALAALISGRPRRFCQMFYQLYYRYLPKRINDYMAKFILAEV